jgi:hypothetical protein
MNKIVKLIIGIVAFIVLIQIGFYVWFAIGMKNANSAKTINTSSSDEYKMNIKKEFSKINNIDIYYQQGNVYFNFIINSEMSLEECKEVVRETKITVQEEDILKLLPKGYTGQETITINFDNAKGIYSFKCPYWLPTEDNSQNKEYKIWYMTINDEPKIQVEF